MSGDGALSTPSSAVAPANQRFFGKYRGIVVQLDPATMRVKANVPSVQTHVPIGWASPCVPFAGPNIGFVSLPDVGTGVWIEFEGGDVSLPIWVGGYWLPGQIPVEATEGVRAIVGKGQKLVLKDADGSVSLQDSLGNLISLGPSGLTITGGSKGDLKITGGPQGDLVITCGQTGNLEITGGSQGNLSISSGAEGDFAIRCSGAGSFKITGGAGGILITSGLQTVQLGNSGVVINSSALVSINNGALEVLP